MAEQTTAAPKRPRLEAPLGACDTHMHFYGSVDRYPVQVPGANPPVPATVSQYRDLQKRLGLERVVVVQPAAYGSDNRCTLDAMAEIGDAARGIAVVERDVSDAELERLTRAGIRGIRMYMLKGAFYDWADLEPMAARVQPFGWHVQLQLDGRKLPEHEEMLKRLPGTLVIDHVGKFLEPVPPEDPAFMSLLRLVEGGRCWVKLSAPYEVSKSGPPHYQDVGRLAKALVKAAPERMVWASNWPHPSVQEKPDDADLLDLLLDWVEDESTRRRVLTDNPAALYGF
jgi:D-galactarolactone isomerase